MSYLRWMGTTQPGMQAADIDEINARLERLERGHAADAQRGGNITHTEYTWSQPFGVWAAPNGAPPTWNYTLTIPSDYGWVFWTCGVKGVWVKSGASPLLDPWPYGFQYRVRINGTQVNPSGNWNWPAANSDFVAAVYQPTKDYSIGGTSPATSRGALRQLAPYSLPAGTHTLQFQPATPLGQAGSAMYIKDIFFWFYVHA